MGAAPGAHKAFCPSGFGSSLKGSLQKASLKDLAYACLPVARRKGRGNFITPFPYEDHGDEDDSRAAGAWSGWVGRALSRVPLSGPLSA